MKYFLLATPPNPIPDIMQHHYETHHKDINACPYPQCNGNLEAKPIPGEAFRRGKMGVPPVITSVCGTCETENNKDDDFQSETETRKSAYGHKELIIARIQQFAADNNITYTDTEVLHFRCKRPYFNKEWPAAKKNKYHVLFALNLVEYQFHHSGHVGSCFKVTKSTPSATVCRFLMPFVASILRDYASMMDENFELDHSTFDDDTGALVFFRALGLEYYNLCSLIWSGLSLSNMDLKFLINGVGRKVTAYSTKYSFKVQRLESSVIMKIGIFAKCMNQVLNQPDVDEVPVAELGRRMLNKFLYHFSKPNELPIPLAALALINDGLFFFSHEFVHLKLETSCAAFHNTVEPRDDESMGDDDNVDDANHLDADEFDYIDVLIPLSQLRIPQNSTKGPEDVENFVQLNVMEDYHKRPDNLEMGMDNLNYIDTLEQFHLCDGKGNKTTSMLPTHSNTDKHHWVRNHNSTVKCMVVCGTQVPNINSTTLTPLMREYYYKCLLCLFKPSRGPGDLLTHSTHEESYHYFLDLAVDSAQVQAAKIFEALNEDYYDTCHDDSVETINAEDRIARDHPCCNPDYDEHNPPQDDEIRNAMNEEFDENDDQLRYTIGFESDLSSGLQAASIFGTSQLPKPSDLPMLPVFTNMEDYLKTLIDPTSFNTPAHNTGTSQFCELTSMSEGVKVTLLRFLSSFAFY